MRRAIYISRSLVGFDQTALADILAVSRVRNERSGVTGLLWWNDETFAQVLEGEFDAVGETMRRIARDRRHVDIAMVGDLHVVDRLFGAWSMSQAGDDPISTEGTAWLVGFSASEPGPEAKRLFYFLLDAGY